MLGKQKSSTGRCHVEMLGLLRAEGKGSIYRGEVFTATKETRKVTHTDSTRKKPGTSDNRCKTSKTPAWAARNWR